MKPSIGNFYGYNTPLPKEKITKDEKKVLLTTRKSVNASQGIPVVKTTKKMMKFEFFKSEALISNQYFVRLVSSNSSILMNTYGYSGGPSKARRTVQSIVDGLNVPVVRLDEIG